MQILCQKYLNSFFLKKKIYLAFLCLKFCVFNFIINKNMFLCKGLVLICTQFHFKQSLSLPLYKILFGQCFISCKGFVQNGKFKMFRYKDMICLCYDLRLTAVVFC